MKTNRRWLVGLALLALGAKGPCTPDAGLTRGPYLQLATSDGITVRWRTGTASGSVVRYGATPGNLDHVVSLPGSTTEHEVRIDALPAESTFYYSIGDGSDVLAGGDADHRFTTAPPIGAVRPTRIWVLGDSGTANFNADAVRDAYLGYTGAQPTDVWLMLGDNAYTAGTDAQYQRAVFDTYPTVLRQTALWPTLGNHDADSSNTPTASGPYFDMFTLPTSGEAGGLASGTEGYYSFDHANIHFICLDSATSDLSPGSEMFDWLAADLANTNQDWTIAFWHHPPYTKGSHDSDTEGSLTAMREQAVPTLESMGVDLVLTGHSHSYERSFLLDGHYGTSGTLTPSMILDDGDGDEAGDGAYLKGTPGPAPHEGAVYAVAGSSGQTGGGSLDHPAMVFSIRQLGSMVLDVNGDRLDAIFLSSAGGVTDRFTILKGP